MVTHCFIQITRTSYLFKMKVSLSITIKLQNDLRMKLMNKTMKLCLNTLCAYLNIRYIHKIKLLSFCTHCTLINANNVTNMYVSIGTIFLKNFYKKNVPSLIYQMGSDRSSDSSQSHFFFTVMKLRFRQTQKKLR